jgi:iron complex outermembrane receptor protein
MLTISTSITADTLSSVTVHDEEPLPSTGDVVPSEYTGTATLLSGDALKRPGTTLAQVLSREASTQVRQSGGLGSYSSATLRGSSSNQVMIYLDGLLLNDATRGGFNLSEIELLLADTVEIYRGLTPIQLNKASLGGAINIRSKKADGKPSLHTTIGGGSFNSRQFGLLSSRKLGEIDLLLSANIRASDNDFPFRNDNGTHLNTADDFNDKRSNSAVKQESLLLKLGRELTDSSRDDASLQYFSKNQHLPDWKNSAFNSAVLDTETLRLQINHRQDTIAQTNWNSKIGGHTSRTTEEYRDSQGRIGLGHQHDRWINDTFGINNYWEHVAATRTLSINADFRHERSRSNDFLNIRPNSKAKRNEFTLTLQESLFMNNERLLLTPSIRYQSIEDKFRIFTQSITESDLSGQVSHSKLSPQFGLKFQANTQLSITSNIGQYQRVPSFFELFGDRGLFLGNEDLKPESGVNFDIGMDWESANKHGYLLEPHAQVSLFHNNINDAISRVYDARGVGKSVNIPGALTYGIEWDTSAKLSKNTKIQIKGTLQNMENHDTVPAFFNKQLPGQAQHSISVYLDQQIKQLNIYYEFLGQYKRFYDTANLLPAADQSTHNMGLKYKYRNIELALELDNIGNDNYEDFNGFPKPGRSLYLTVTYSGEPPT